MILRHFPKPCPPEGWPNLVIHARTHEIDYPEHAGPLSLKCVFAGEEIHQVGSVPYRVDTGSMLLLNHGRSYSSHIRSTRPVETFSIFFERSFAADTLRGLTLPAEPLLDEPTPASAQPVEFFETLYPLRPALAQRLARMRDELIADFEPATPLDEHLRGVLTHLLLEHLEVGECIGRLAASRPATRLEQYRRLLRARDYLEGHIASAVNLETTASVACLSPFHMHRLFKEAFGETPHEYLTRRRLERAREMLATTDLPISEICRRVGYQSLGSFSQLVKKRYGASPLELRRQLAVH